MAEVLTAQFCEENFEGIKVHENGDAARGYSEGFPDGASLYGAGCAASFVLPDQTAEMREFGVDCDCTAAVDEAIAAFNRWTLANLGSGGE